MLSRIHYAIDILEDMQSDLEVLEVADAYDIIDEVIRILMAIEEDT